MVIDINFYYYFYMKIDGISKRFETVFPSKAGHSLRQRSNEESRR